MRYNLTHLSLRHVDPLPFPFTRKVTFNVLIAAHIESAFHGSLLFIWISRAAQKYTLAIWRKINRKEFMRNRPQYREYPKHLISSTRPPLCKSARRTTYRLSATYFDREKQRAIVDLTWKRRTLVGPTRSKTFSVKQVVYIARANY